MSAPLPEPIAQMREAVIGAPGVDGLLQGLLALLRTARDSQTVATALEGIDAGAYVNAEIRSDVAALLRDAGALELAGEWDPVMSRLASGGAPHPAPEASAKSRGKAVSFDDIGGLEDVKKQMRRRIINPFLKQELFQRFRKTAGGGVLMYGPPGCGKTMLARALAQECNARFMNVKAADLLHAYRGETERNISGLFDQARLNAPTVLFFDEVEAIAQKRQFNSQEVVNSGVSALLTEMDGFEGGNENVLMLGATNVPWSLDSAFRRPGRFSRTFFVPPPDKVARRFILLEALKDKPMDSALSVDGVVARTAGYSGADLIEIVETATDYAIEDSASLDAIAPITTEHLGEALGEVRPSTGEWFGQASAYANHANKDGIYDDLAVFLKKHKR